MRSDPEAPKARTGPLGRLARHCPVSRVWSSGLKYACGSRLPRRCGPPRRIPPGAVAPRAIPIGTGGHSAVQGLAPWATAPKRAAGGTARATRTYAENLGFMTLAAVTKRRRCRDEAPRTS